MINLIFSLFTLTPSDSIVEKINSFYQEIQGLQTNFEEIIFYKDINRQDTLRGQLFLKRDNLVRIEVKAKEEEELILSDGKLFWLYLKGQKQVIKKQVSNVFPITLSDLFFFKTGNEFNIELLKEGETFYIIALIPLKTDFIYQKVTLKIHKESLLPIELYLVDKDFNTYNFYFQECRVNSLIPDTLFQFTPPKGVEIIE